MTNETLIADLKESGAIVSVPVERAFHSIDRAKFVPEEHAAEAYLDTALPIGEGQTISQPTVVAYCLEWLNVRPGHKVLDVGSGSGFTTALLAHLVGHAGSVIGLELVPALVALGSRNLSHYAFPHARIEQAGKELGKKSAAPFDRILVSAAADEVPHSLRGQLKDGGRMVIPVKSAICVVRRSGNDFPTERHEGFSFVPLITRSRHGSH